MTLGHNHVGIASCQALSEVLDALGSLRVLTLDHTCLTNKSLLAMAGAAPAHLEELDLSHNLIEGEEGGATLSRLLKGWASLRELKCCWNTIGRKGCVRLATALAENSILRRLDLGMNSVGDEGASALAQAVLKNRSIRHLSLSLRRNDVGRRAALTWARTIAEASSVLDELDLQDNPLGSSGGRAIFRSLLSEVQPVSARIILHGCNFTPQSDHNAGKVFDHGCPFLNAPYTLSLDDAYDSSVAWALYRLAAESLGSTTRTELVNVKWQPPPGSNEASWFAADLKVCEVDNSGRWNGQPFKIPHHGCLTLDIRSTTAPATASDTISDVSLNRLFTLLQKSQDEAELITWLKLAARDVALNSQQAQQLIDSLKTMPSKAGEPDSDKQGNGLGESLSGSQTGLLEDIILTCMNKLVDAGAKFDFIRHNIPTIDARHKLVARATLESYRWTPLNATGRYRLCLSNDNHCEVLKKLAALQDTEGACLRQQTRGDTSQYLNGSNFRNVTLDGRGPMKLPSNSRGLISSLPVKGILQFDYVSTGTSIGSIASSRSSASAAIAAAAATAAALGDGEGSHSSSSRRSTRIANRGSGSSRLSSIDLSRRRSRGGSKARLSLSQTARPSFSQAAQGRRVSGALIRVKARARQAQRVGDVQLISGKELRAMMDHIGASARARRASTRVNDRVAIAELQLAMSRFWISTAQIERVLDCFDDSEMLTVILALFNRIADKQNFSNVLCYLPSHQAAEACKRLGYLNIVNPLKPWLPVPYCLDTSFPDERKVLQLMLDLGGHEKGGLNIRDDPERSTVSLVHLYAKLGRIHSDAKSIYTVVFSYAQVGEFGNVPDWERRKKILPSFLIGGEPQQPHLYDIIDQYHELQRLEKLVPGVAIETQFKNHSEGAAKERGSKNERDRAYSFVRRRLSALQRQRDDVKEVQRLAAAAAEAKARAAPTRIPRVAAARRTSLTKAQRQVPKATYES
ncbi:unnamed protein product [Chrysoparadoxa australica]